VAFVLPCVVVWALIPKLATDTGNVDAQAFLLYSSMVSAVVLAAWTTVRKRWDGLLSHTASDLARLTGVAFLGTFGYYAILYTAYAPASKAATPAVVLVAQYTWPAWSVVWWALLYDGKVSRRVAASLGVGLVAVWLVASSEVSQPAAWRLATVVLAATMFGLYSALLQRLKYEPLSTHTFCFAAAVMMSGLVHLATLDLPDWPDAAARKAILINGTFVNGISYVLWYRALRAAPVTFVAPWISLTPVLAAIYLGDWDLTRSQWAALGLVFTSVLLAMSARDGGRWGRSSDSTAPLDLRHTREPRREETPRRLSA
jgi:drug/metabolite transporter (DMT)-like permease